MLFFAVATVVAVVQATGSDAPPVSDALQASAVAQQTQAQVQATASEMGIGEARSAQTAAPTERVQTEAQEAATADQTSASQESSGGGQISSPTVVEDAQSQAAAEEQPEASPVEAEHPLRGFIVPIRGACITEFEGHLPSSPRAYRNDGVHEGIDLYQWASCTTVDYDTEILAAKAGVVIRADLDYVDITPADWDRFIAANWEGEGILDELRGRQVWIDHGRGIVTRYAHLSVIMDGIAVGAEVEQGQVIGYPGESGQQEVYNEPGTDIHLHFEIRIGDGWLGQGEKPQAARQLYLEAFGLAPSSSQ